MKRGFTIVELLMVVGVIAILAGIVTTAASSAIRNARGRRADAMKRVLQAGINAYYSREGEWPGTKLNSLADEGVGNHNDKVKTLEASDADLAFQELVRKSVEEGSSPYLDPSGLFVASKAVADAGEPTGGDGGDEGRGGNGRDFRSCFTKGKHTTTMSIAEMAFGYQQRKSGKFRRYRISYNTQTDSVSVLKQSADENED